MTVIFDPAVASAISRCLTARSIDRARGTTRAHPRPCGWCIDDLATLRSMVEGFNAWAEFNQRTNTAQRHDVRIFLEKPKEEQERLIVEAQAFPEEAAPPPASPVQTLDPSPADARIPQPPPWLGGPS